MSGTAGSASTTIWTGWNGQYRVATLTVLTDTATGGTGAAATLVVANNNTWTNWNQTYTVTTVYSGIGGGSASTPTITTTDPWIVWNGSFTAGQRTFNPRISDEEYQAQTRQAEERRAEWHAREQADRIEREKAKARAAIILRENLTDEQKAELAEKKYFTIGVIDGKSGERRTYRIHHGRSRNVEQVDAEGRRIRRLCIHPAIDCPDEDTMLAQKLLLETEEDRFLRIANHS